MNTQINITIPNRWKTELERIARKEAYEADKNITYIDIIRDAISTRCGFLDKQKYSNDVISFIETYGASVIPSQKRDLRDGKPRPLIELYDHQKRFLHFLENEENEKIIVPKFREGGFTTLSILWSLWKCMYNDNVYVNYFTLNNHNTISANNMLIKINESFPQELKSDILQDELSEFMHEDFRSVSFDNGSCIDFATMSAGSFLNIKDSPNLILIIDEASSMEYFDNIWHNKLQHLRSAKIIIMSTSKKDSWFNVMACNAKNELTTHSLFDCSFRDSELYSADKERELIDTLGEARYKQDYLCELF